VGTGLPSSNFGLRGKNLGHVIYRDFGPNTGLPNMPLRIFVIYGRLHPLRTYLCYTTTQNSCLQCSQNLNKEYMNEFLASCSTVLCNRNLYKMQQKKSENCTCTHCRCTHEHFYPRKKKHEVQFYVTWQLALALVRRATSDKWRKRRYPLHPPTERRHRDHLLLFPATFERSKSRARSQVTPHRSRGAPPRRAARRATPPPRPSTTTYAI
jgi:hypothetical protein